MSISVNSPLDGAEFQLGSIIEFKGTTSQEIASVTLVSPFGGKEFNLNTVPVSGGNWSAACSFNTGGKRTVIIKGFDGTNSLVDSVQIQINLIVYTDLVPIPAGLNPGLSSARSATMISALGRPCNPTDDCSPVTDPGVKALLTTQNVGPFTVTGLKPAVDALKRIFEKVKQEKPDLYKQLGTAGMLCCRKVRGGSNFSNHSWGTAIDIKISSELDAVGDGKTQAGLLQLAPYFNSEGFFWGAGFSNRAREDSMHFEASEELINKWKATKEIPDSKLVCVL